VTLVVLLANYNCTKSKGINYSYNYTHNCAISTIAFSSLKKKH